MCIIDKNRGELKAANGGLNGVDFAPVYEALEKAGVAVCVAAGNDAHA